MMDNEQRFREKLKLLNEEFVDFISNAFKENPSYDFTPSVTDYVQHVKELDNMYAPKPTERKIVVAKRRVTTPAVKPVEKPKEASLPTILEPKKLSNGLVEPVGQFAFAPKVQMPEIPSFNKTPAFSAPKSNNQSTPLSQGRKRRQEPLDYDDMRGKSSNDYGKADKESETPVKVPSNIAALEARLNAEKESQKQTPQLPSIFNSNTSGNSGSFQFQSKISNAGKESNEKSPQASSLFSAVSKPPASGLFDFGNKDKMNSSDTSEANRKSPQLPSFFSSNIQTSGLFEKNNKEKESHEKSPQGASLFSGLSNTSTTAGLFNFGNKITNAESTEKTPQSSLFSSLSKPLTSGSINFGVNTTTEKESQGKTDQLSSIFSSTSNSGLFNFSNKNANNTPSSTSVPPNPLFGGLVNSTGGSLSFNYKPAENPKSSAASNGETSTSNNKEGEDDAEDAPPPKVEIVHHDEPGIIFIIFLLKLYPFRCCFFNKMFSFQFC
jgi:hypothetical protein